MRFSTKEDIEATLSETFMVLSEFEAYERAALRRGIDVRRARDVQPMGVGMEWEATFSLRGSTRDITLSLVEYDPPHGFRFESDSQGLEGELKLELISLAPHRTRMSVTLDLAPKSLSARLLLQSLKLAKTNLNKRFKSKTSDFARAIEDRVARARMG
jgi:hypothetical protein